jgi:non-ribosomal peptide synthetase component F
VLSEHLTEALKALSYQEGVSLFVTLLATFKTLLYRYTGQEDILICSPVAGRNRVETKKLIGYFNNLVVMRTDLSGNPSFRDLVGRVSRVTLGTYEHQDLPFQKLAELPNLARTPLNRAMFVLQNTPSQPVEIAGIAIIPLDLDSETTNFDLSLSMYEKGKQLVGLLQYNMALFDTTTVTQMLEHFQSLFDSLVTNPNQRLSDLPSFIKTESSQLFNKIVESTFIAPQKEIERIIAEVWQEVLQLEKVSIHCNFFDLGGSSLAMIRMYSKLRELFDSPLSVVDLFKHPTVSGMARYLSQERRGEQSTFQHIHDSAKRQKEAIRQQQKLLKLRRRVNE